MSNDEKIAAHLVYLFAVLTFISRDNSEDWWYKFCVDHYAKLQGSDPFAATILWSLRMEDKNNDLDDWFQYLE